MKQPATDRILISHAPTNRQVKSTQEFLAAVKRLQDEGYPVDLDLIEHRPWKECLERKAKADIYFDQVILGYGCNAIEAWGMGIPVVAGAQDETLDEMERRFGHLPFYHATEETIYEALRELVEDPELRQRYGQIGNEYVRKYHDEPVVVEQLKGLYRRAMGQSEEAAA
jgi:glycosyltransferase involved in cell wall biosynthesis